MRIAIVLKTFTTNRGGAEVWSSAFVRWLLAQGHEVHVVASKASSDVQQMGIRLHLIPTRSSIRFAARCERLLKKLNVDIVHDMGAGWYFDVFQSHVGSLSQYREALLRLMPASKARRKRFAAVVLPTYWRKNQMMRRQYSDTQDAKFIALSKVIADDFERVHGISSGKIEVIPNGVDVTRFSPTPDAEVRRETRRSLGTDEHSLILLLVAQNHQLKGLPAVIEAVGRLLRQQENIHVAVVGGAPVASHVSRIEELGITSRVHYTGWADPVPYYQAADIYVHPSHYDACSLGVLEALASGLPVITSAANGAGELIPQGEAGFVVQDAEDVTSLSEHIATLSDFETRRRMAVRARQVAERNTLKHNFERIEVVYNQIIDSRGGAKIVSAAVGQERPCRKSA